MHVFKDLVIEAEDPGALERVLNAVQTLLPPRWVRDGGKEDESRRFGSAVPMRCFAFEGEGSTPGAALWIAIQGNRAEVGNIVPLAVGSLGHEAYNDIVARFSVAVRKAVASVGAAKVVETSAHQDLEDWLPSDVAVAFRQFAGNANPSTGSAHPNDLARWHTFITMAHMANVEADPVLLGRWLQENCGWSEDVVGGLVIEYEQGRHLLHTYDAAAGR